MDKYLVSPTLPEIISTQGLLSLYLKCNKAKAVLQPATHVHNGLPRHTLAQILRLLPLEHHIHKALGQPLVGEIDA